MAYEQIQMDVDRGVATITLYRPEQLNTWTAIMSRELGEAMQVCDQDDTIRAVIVTGSGRAFCAGADLSGGESGFTPSEGEKRPTPVSETVWPYQIRKPVIAAINGAAVGVGLTYPMLADIRLAAENAKLGFAMVRRGILPELASHITVAQVAGFSNAADLLLTGRIITGAEAKEMGIISECLPKEALMDRAQAIARDITENTAPVSVALSKQLLWEGLADRMPALMAKEGKIIKWLGSSIDVKEGVEAFLEKRQPNWQMSVAKDIPAEF
ncbi:MAG: enoyl-CoA hydratase-related protein [Pseudomonadota bacterium]